MNDTRRGLMHHPVETESLQLRFAQRVVACLSIRSEQTAHDVSERLRVARERALDGARARRAVAPSPLVMAGSGGAATLALGDGPQSPWWRRIGTVLPLLALVAGLMLIQYQHARERIAAVAEIDVDLLVDDLPPSAYSDPGFVEFLKTARE